MIVHFAGSEDVQSICGRGVSDTGMVYGRLSSVRTEATCVYCLGMLRRLDEALAAQKAMEGI